MLIIQKNYTHLFGFRPPSAKQKSKPKEVVPSPSSSSLSSPNESCYSFVRRALKVSRINTTQISSKKLNLKKIVFTNIWHFK